MDLRWEKQVRAFTDRVDRRVGVGFLLCLECPPLSSPPSNLHFDLFLNSSVPSCFDFNKYFDGVRAGFGTLHWCEARVGGITHFIPCSY